MLLIDEIFQTDVTDKLNTLTGVSVLDGFLVHYADDLEAGDNGISFPCVAIQLKSEDSQFVNNTVSSEYTYTLIGAVSALDFTTVNTRMAELLRSVRKVLNVDFYTGKSKAQSIKLGVASISLPDATDIYALFEVPLTIKLIEKEGQ